MVGPAGVEPAPASFGDSRLQSLSGPMYFSHVQRHLSSPARGTKRRAPPGCSASRSCDLGRRDARPACERPRRSRIACTAGRVPAARHHGRHQPRPYSAAGEWQRSLRCAALRPCTRAYRSDGLADYEPCLAVVQILSRTGCTLAAPTRRPTPAFAGTRSSRTGVSSDAAPAPFLGIDGTCTDEELGACRHTQSTARIQVEPARLCAYDPCLHYKLVEKAGIEPAFPVCKTGVLPARRLPHFVDHARGVEPRSQGLQPCALAARPGMVKVGAGDWSRTSSYGVAPRRAASTPHQHMVLLAGLEPACPRS
jgi:hypothetical protein